MDDPSYISIILISFKTIKLGLKFWKIFQKEYYYSLLSIPGIILHVYDLREMDC